MRVAKGTDVVFLENGKAKFKPDGKKGETMEVAQGETVVINADGDLTGVPFEKLKATRVDRLVEKTRARQQRQRISGDALLVLEVPDAVLTEAQRIEMIHEERGRKLKQRLALETGRLRQ